MKERATFTTDLWDLTSFFFVAPDSNTRRNRPKNTGRATTGAS